MRGVADEMAEMLKRATAAFRLFWRRVSEKTVREWTLRRPGGIAGGKRRTAFVGFTVQGLAGLLARGELLNHFLACLVPEFWLGLHPKSFAFDVVEHSLKLLAK